MTRRRKVRELAQRPRPADLEHAPETAAVRLPPSEEAQRGERQDRNAEQGPGALKDPRADATGEGTVTELARDLDEESVRLLEQNALKTSPRAAPGSPRPRPF